MAEKKARTGISMSPKVEKMIEGSRDAEKTAPKGPTQNRVHLLGGFSRVHRAATQKRTQLVRPVSAPGPGFAANDF